MKGFRDSLEYLLSLEGRERRQRTIGHRFAEGLKLQFAVETGENSVAATGAVVTERGVGSFSRHVVVENVIMRECEDAKM